MAVESTADQQQIERTAAVLSSPPPGAAALGQCVAWRGSAADQGKTIIQGTTMFLAQAAKQFEIWTGHRAPAEVFEEKLHA